MRELERLLAWLVQRESSQDSDWLIELVGLLRPAKGEADQAAVERIDALCERLQASPELARALARHFFTLFTGRRQRHLLAETGVILESGFSAGLLSRLTRRVLPEVPDQRLWVDLMGMVFSQRTDGGWVAAVGAARWARLLALLRDAGADEADVHRGQAQLRAETLRALSLLAHRLATLGNDAALLRYYTPPERHDSPFLAQAAALLDWCARAGAAALEGAALEEASTEPVLDRIAQCEQALAQVRQLAHEQGTSVALTRLLLQARQSTRRIRTLLAIVEAQDRQASNADIARLFVSLVEGECARRSLRKLWSRSTDMLALQVTENASRTGEHYVSETRREYWAMARSAMGAGVIVGFMALAKILLARLHLPPFWEAFAFGLNYATGFVLIHLLHFTVATKQPAMTAARIAAVVDEERDRGGSLERLARLTAQISRTQFIAILGNVVLAFPVAMALGWLWIEAFGASVTDAAKSAKLLGDIHPWHSAALPHAAIAGVCLFLAGIISGYYDNRCVYARIPQRIASLAWLSRLIGPPRSTRLAAYVEHNLGAIAGNVAFGFMLGFVGFFGHILGMPLDIRHVTFSAANLAFGLVGAGFAVSAPEVAICLAGLVLVALANLGVSFVLALQTALKARGLRLQGVREFVRVLGAEWRRHPGSFVVPPRGSEERQPH